MCASASAVSAELLSPAFSFALADFNWKRLNGLPHVDRCNLRLKRPQNTTLALVRLYSMHIWIWIPDAKDPLVRLNIYDSLIPETKTNLPDPTHDIHHTIKGLTFNNERAWALP